MQKISDVRKLIDEENRTWYRAHDVFKVMGISWGGEKAIYNKGLDKEFKILKVKESSKTAYFLSEVGVFKLAAQGLTKESARIFNHIASRYFMDFSLDEI
jgi:prophage antirepressor-like protein